MKFKKVMFIDSGYYYYLHIDYPDPQISFFERKHNNMYIDEARLSSWQFAQLRIGDKISLPKQVDCKIIN